MNFGRATSADPAPRAPEGGRGGGKGKGKGKGLSEGSARDAEGAKGGGKGWRQMGRGGKGGYDSTWTPFKINECYICRYDGREYMHVFYECPHWQKYQQDKHQKIQGRGAESSRPTPVTVTPPPPQQ